MSVAEKLKSIKTNVPKVYQQGIEKVISLFKASETSCKQLFYNKTTITEVPYFDTSKVTDFTGMLYNCKALTKVPQYDTSSGTTMENMFRGCTVLTKIPQIDTSKSTKFSNMFNACKALTEVPQFDTSQGTAFNSMFLQCSALETIPLLNLTNATTYSSAFSSCAKLKNITFEGTIPVGSAYFAASTELTLTSLKSIITALQDCSAVELQYQGTLTLPSECWDLLATEGDTAPGGYTWQNYVTNVLYWNI